MTVEDREITRPRAQATRPDVRLERVTKRFDDVVAVDDVSLAVEHGSFFAMLGPSGCGKTTTLRMIGGFEQPTAGAIYLGDREVTGLPPYRRDVNTVFQSYALFPHLSIFENVAFGLRRKGLRGVQLRGRVERILELVELGGYGRRKPRQLSGGQQQRVALARALVLKPSVLLLDEPLGALDAKLRKYLQADLHALQREVGITFIYVTHDQEEALTMSDRLAVMDDGRVAQVGSPTEVYEQPATAYVADFLGVANLVAATGEHGSNGRRQVHLGDFLLDAVGDGPAGPVKLVIRPERVRVSPGEPSGPNCVPAMVERVVYVGATTQVHVRLPGGEAIQALTANHDGRPEWPAGTPVGVTLPADALRALPA